MVLVYTYFEGCMKFKISHVTTLASDVSRIPSFRQHLSTNSKYPSASVEDSGCTGERQRLHPRYRSVSKISQSKSKDKLRQQRVDATEFRFQYFLNRQGSHFSFASSRFMSIADCYIRIRQKNKFRVALTTVQSFVSILHITLFSKLARVMHTKHAQWECEDSFKVGVVLSAKWRVLCK